MSLSRFDVGVGTVVVALGALWSASRNPAVFVDPIAGLDELRGVGLLMVATATLLLLAWTTRRLRVGPAAAWAVLAALCTVGAGWRRLPSSSWVTEVAIVGWLLAPIGLVLAAGAMDGPPRRRPLVVWAAGVAAAVLAVAAAIDDDGQGLGGAMGEGAGRTASVSTRVVLALHTASLVVLVAAVAFGSLRHHRAVRGTWSVSMCLTALAVACAAERCVHLLPSTVTTDQLHLTYRPWATLVVLNLPPLATVSVALALCRAVLIQPYRPGDGARGAVVMRNEDPVDALRRDLASWLGDPTLEIAYPVEGGWVTAQGRKVTQGDGRGETLVAIDGVPVGLIMHDPLLAEDEGLVATAAVLAAEALSANQILAVGTAGLAEEQRVTSRLLQVDDVEREALLRQLECGPFEALRSAAAALRFGAPVRVVVPILQDATADVRNLSHGLHPPDLQQFGLSAVLANRSGVPSRRLPPSVELTVFAAARDDPSCTLEDRGTMVVVHRSNADLDQSVADRVDALGGQVDGTRVIIPVELG